MTYKREDIIEEYEKAASHYDKGSSDCKWAAPSFVGNDLKKRQLLKSGTRVIDFAAGTGLLSANLRQAAQNGPLHITALDLSRDMLNQLKAKNLANVLQRHDITEPWSVKEHSFDIAAATGVGEYLTSHQLNLTINHAAKALKKNGHIAFTYRPEDNSGDNQKFHAPKSVEETFTKASFDILEHKPFDAYVGNDGKTIIHQYILARKL